MLSLRMGCWNLLALAEGAGSGCSSPKDCSCLLVFVAPGSSAAAIVVAAAFAEHKGCIRLAEIRIGFAVAVAVAAVMAQLRKDQIQLVAAGNHPGIRSDSQFVAVGGIAGLDPGSSQLAAGSCRQDFQTSPLQLVAGILGCNQ